MLPTFLIIGAQKAATTTLWAHLGRHPDIFVPPMKEPNFFLEEVRWDLGVGWYEELFEPGRDKPVRGEASTGYTMWPMFAGVPARMASVVPDVKLVYLVREPIERMVSSWQHLMADHIEYKGLEESLLNDLRYLSMSQYATQIEQYLEYFDRDQLLVEKTEDLRSDPAGVLGRVCRFIGADDSWTFSDLNARDNPSATKLMPRWGTRKAIRSLNLLHSKGLTAVLKQQRRWPFYRPFRSEELAASDDTRRRLREYLRPDLQRLASLAGPGFRVWDSVAFSSPLALGTAPEQGPPAAAGVG